MAASDRGEARIAYLFLTLMALCFGGTWVAGKLGVESIAPLSVAAIRFTLASLLLFGWLRLRGAGIGRLARADLPLVLAMGSTAVAGYNILFLYGLTLAPASDGAILVPGLAPVFTVALAAPLLGERLGLQGLVGMAVAFGGLLLVVAPSSEAGPQRLVGDVLFVAGALCWAVYSLIGPRATRRFGPAGATFWSTLCGATILIPLALLEGGWRRLPSAPPEALLGVLYLAVFGTVLAFVFFYEGVRRVGPSRATAFAFLVPVVGVLSSVLLLGEALGAGTFVGGALVLLGVWIVQRRPRTERAPLASATEA